MNTTDTNILADNKQEAEEKKDTIVSKKSRGMSSYKYEDIFITILAVIFAIIGIYSYTLIH